VRHRHGETAPPRGNNSPGMPRWMGGGGGRGGRGDQVSQSVSQSVGDGTSELCWAAPPKTLTPRLLWN